MSKDKDNQEDQNEKNAQGKLKLSAKDKVWVILAIVVIIVGFIIAVIYDL